MEQSRSASIVEPFCHCSKPDASQSARVLVGINSKFELRDNNLVAYDASYHRAGSTGGAAVCNSPGGVAAELSSTPREGAQGTGSMPEMRLRPPRHPGPLPRMRDRLVEQGQRMRRRKRKGVGKRKGSPLITLGTKPAVSLKGNPRQLRIGRDPSQLGGSMRQNPGFS